MEQEEQLCLKKSGEISVPLWFCLLRERAGRQVPGQEAIHFVWWGLQREAWGVLKADFDPLGPSSLSRSFLGCTVARIMTPAPQRGQDYMENRACLWDTFPKAFPFSV